MIKWEICKIWRRLAYFMGKWTFVMKKLNYVGQKPSVRHLTRCVIHLVHNDHQKTREKTLLFSEAASQVILRDFSGLIIFRMMTKSFVVQTTILNETKTN